MTDQIARRENAAPGKWRTRFLSANIQLWAYFLFILFIIYVLLLKCTPFAKLLSCLCPSLCGLRFRSFAHKDSLSALLFNFSVIYVLFVGLLKHTQFGMSLLFSELIRTQQEVTLFGRAFSRCCIFSCPILTPDWLIDRRRPISALTLENFKWPFICKCSASSDPFHVCTPTILCPRTRGV